MPLRPLLLAVALVACSGADKDASDTLSGTTPAPTGDTGAPTGPTSTPGPTPTASPTGDTGTPLTTVSTLSGLSAVPHATFGSLLEVTWTQDTAADVVVEYSVDAGVWLATPSAPYDAGTHTRIVAGAPYDHDVTWRVVAGGAASAEQVTATGPVPDFVPITTVTTYDAAGVDPASPYVLLSVPALDEGFGGAWHVMIVDRQGRPVWVRRSDPGRMSMHPRLSYDGTAILHDQNQFWVDFRSLGVDGTVQKLRLDGTLVHEWPTPGLHHPHQELPDGSLAYGAFTSLYDESLAITAPDGSLDYLWSCDSWAQGIGELAMCASNTLNYDAATDTFLFSFWTLETVVQIDATSGEALRWFGHAEGSYAFDPVESTFWFQHGAHLTPEGTLLVSTHQSQPDVQLVAREYTIDEASETLHEIWSVGVDQGVDGWQMGDAYRTPSGHTLQSYGTQSRVREYQPDGTVVWDLAWPQTTHIGRVTPIPDLYALLP